MFVTRKRRNREMAELANYMSMDIEDQMPMTTVATLRLLAGVGDEQDEQIVHEAGPRAADLFARVHELVESAAAFIEAHDEAKREVEADAEELTAAIDADAVKDAA